MVVEQAREDPKDKKELSSVLYQMDGFAAQCVERYLELSNHKESCLKEVPTPSLDETAFLFTADWETKGELAGVCAKIVMKVLFMARFYRYDLLFAVNSLARYLTKWNTACDRNYIALSATSTVPKTYAFDPMLEIPLINVIWR